ncbi:MAG: hypothetical protein EHJ95_02410, partial [Methanobacteriota archaeon]
MTRVLVIGIDSMDALLVQQYKDHLPSLSRLYHETPHISMHSVFPPDSDTAWASIYTGWNPARHGIVNFVDPLEKASIYQTDYLDSKKIQGSTFWDFAGKAGKRVCLVNPHVGYPVWPVNGFMLSRISKKKGFAAYPPDSLHTLVLDGLEAPDRIPDSISEYPRYLDTCRSVVLAEISFAKHLLHEKPWDLFFFYSSMLDFIQHIFWSYCDPADPMYPGGGNQFRDAILDFYILYDRGVRELMAEVEDQDVAVVVLSDHGHAMRPLDLININEILRMQGYLVARSGVAAPVNSMTDSLKRYLVNIAQRTALRGTALKMLRRFPKVKELYTTPASIDFKRSIARCTDLSGMKSYAYGGILLTRDLLPGPRYAEVRDDIIGRLREFRHPTTQQPVFAWVRYRDEMYSGPYLERLPDILFRLKEGYGAGWAVNEGLLSRAHTHNFFPGSHRGETPVFFLENTGNRKVARMQATLLDVAPTILDLLEVPYDQGQFDGTSL